jgi:hypothetical protein
MTATSARIPEVVLAPGESIFSLEFAALHFAAPDQNQYAYRLEGSDHGWNEIGSRHSAAYSALAPGDYVLAVRATNCDGISSREDLKLRIRVLPPWHGTWWFRMLLAVRHEHQSRVVADLRAVGHAHSSLARYQSVARGAAVFEGSNRCPGVWAL